ncbi:Transmembrane protein 165 [Thelohanellus kitauei]|uniref:GDT1 family protein n=1 Tax=Thelohanellus kitauei TaxID=669202 RepID=A0A0C2MZU8_THEKT|nr:Transmembrane protein 165 [Thelohanellus kitauei]
MPPVKFALDGSPIDWERWSGLISSFSIVFFSEVFDKTFFIAAIMSMRHSRLGVFLGSILALFLMTTLSACLGSLSVVLLPPRICAVISCIIMYAFGGKMIYESYVMDPNNEMEDARMEINKRKFVSVILIDIISKNRSSFKLFYPGVAEMHTWYIWADFDALVSNNDHDIHRRVGGSFTTQYDCTSCTSSIYFVTRILYL